MSDPDALRSAIRTKVAAAPGMAAETSERVESVADELMPFASAMSQARDGALSAEARSLVWLFAYRLGDQGVTALATTAALAAWRDAVDTEGARRAVDEALPLLLDGYARAREDRARAELQRALGESMLVTEVAAGVVLAVAAGPLDADAARLLADRTGQRMLHGGARAVVVDLSGVTDPTDAVVSELWAIAGSARMLGAHAVMVGDGDATAHEGVRSAASLAKALELLVRECGVSLVSPGDLVAWAWASMRAKG